MPECIVICNFILLNVSLFGLRITKMQVKKKKNLEKFGDIPPKSRLA